MSCLHVSCRFLPLLRVTPGAQHSSPNWWAMSLSPVNCHPSCCQGWCWAGWPLQMQALSSSWFGRLVAAHVTCPLSSLLAWTRGKASWYAWHQGNAGVARELAVSPANCVRDFIFRFGLTISPDHESLLWVGEPWDSDGYEFRVILLLGGMSSQTKELHLPWATVLRCQLPTWFTPSCQLKKTGTPGYLEAKPHGKARSKTRLPEAVVFELPWDFFVG